MSPAPIANRVSVTAGDSEPTRRPPGTALFGSFTAAERGPCARRELQAERERGASPSFTRAAFGGSRFAGFRGVRVAFVQEAQAVEREIHVHLLHAFGVLGDERR